jgi:hypothetical protein
MCFIAVEKWEALALTGTLHSGLAAMTLAATVTNRCRRIAPTLRRAALERCCMMLVL